MYANFYSYLLFLKVKVLILINKIYQEPTNGRWHQSSFVSFFSMCCLYRVIFDWTLSLTQPLTPATRRKEWIPRQKPTQRWHLARNTGTTRGRVLRIACVELPCVWSRTPSRTRPAPAAWVVGPGRFETDAGHSHGTCESHIELHLKYKTIILEIFSWFITCKIPFVMQNIYC
jgi:hypothetical protein